jgi:ABC-type tungstate transport system permease subunit
MIAARTKRNADFGWPRAKHQKMPVANGILKPALVWGPTLNFAVQADAYALADRATWLTFKNKTTHMPLFQGDPHYLTNMALFWLAKPIARQ